MLATRGYLSWEMWEGEGPHGPAKQGEHRQEWSTMIHKGDTEAMGRRRTFFSGA